MTRERTTLRCAIYTRKSTDEGLDQPFNSLDAQRSACEAYVLSQAGEGWTCIPELYDDGGWSGGSMDRPALKALMAQIEKRRVDVVVVYKVDRLTRSLMDFARIVELFDRHEVSFVSVTQAFNTTNSMGRLTLNVLLSFAQFEREVTAERIRDKIAASRARGMWMGGHVPLGYDLGKRVLLVNDTEAAQVRHMFERYLVLGSLVALAQELDRDGYRSKRSISRGGVERGGVRFSCGAIAHILKNRLYLGEAVHKGVSYPGDHPAIVEEALFAEVKERLAANKHRHVNRKTRSAACPLRGKIFDSEGLPMRPTFSHGRGRNIYRYYASESLLPQGKVAGSGNMGGMRVSAEQVERRILSELSVLLPIGAVVTDIYDAIVRATCSNNKLHVALNPTAVPLESVDGDILLERARSIDQGVKVVDGYLHLTVEIPPVRRGKTINHASSLTRQERHQRLAELVRASHRKLEALNASPLRPDDHVHMRAPVNEWARERIGIGLLAPDIQKALLLGLLPDGTDPSKLSSRDLPLDWEEQRRFLGIGR